MIVVRQDRLGTNIRRRWEKGGVLCRLCPTEQLLFFHNLARTHPMELSNGTTVPLIDYIAVTRCDAAAPPTFKG